jgi:hypothetical protein
LPYLFAVFAVILILFREGRAFFAAICV